MGSSTLMDIIGSFLVSGFLLLMGLQLNATSNEVKAVYSQNFNLQTNLTAVVDIMESDFRKIGYCRDWRKVADPTQSIRIADSNRIRFRCDYNNDGHLDSVTYAVSLTNKLLDTPNPNDRLLYRILNTDTTTLRLGITQFKFEYRDSEDTTIAFPITDPRLVYYMTITVAVSNPAPYVDQYANDPSKYQVYWKQMRLITKNLANR